MNANVGIEPLDGVKQHREYDDHTAYKLYLNEIGRVKLLTADQEIELAARIKQGDKAAREHMIKANLRLVVKIARDFEGLGLPFLDLINEGNIGLMKGVERFDPTKGAKLSTYAAWWIKQSIKRALADHSRTIRLPVHMVDKLSKMRWAEKRLGDNLGRKPTELELSEELGISVQDVRDLSGSSIRTTSLDSPAGDSDATIGEVIEDKNARSPLEYLVEKTTGDMLRELIKTLDPREATILRYRFGLDDGDEKTLEEVGRKFGLTRERIRQVQNIALNKLRKRIEKLDRKNPVGI